MDRTTLPLTSAPPIASHSLIFHGHKVVRMTGFVVGTRLRCPEGHAVGDPSRLLEDGAVSCDHRPADGHDACGALLYLLVLPARGARRRIWAAQCTQVELAEIERLGLDADAVVAYFGATFTRGVA